VAVYVAGREAELAALRAFVDGILEGAAALVLGGEAGMGKTTLWSAAVRDAQERGLRVLRAVPAESETELSFAAVGDLLDGVLDELLASLPTAQRRALSRALVLENDEGPPPDPHAVGVAMLSGLRALAASGPLVVAVDDVQWLDPASSAGLGYAARRLREEPVGLLLARRTGLACALPDELRRSLPAERYREVEVGPLDVAALHHVVQGHLGVVLPRPLLAEVHGAAGGNPFYALELVRTLRRTGVSVEAGQPLPVPESLHDLVLARVQALPPESRDFLVAAAAHAHPTVAITEAASGVTRDAGLPPALEARIVELDGDRIRFTHPLLAAGAYETADPLRRHAIHARLADLLEDPEARAWQLAASAVRPDVRVAAALDEAARHARSRGAPRPAALLLDRAHELTPRDRPDDAARRAIDAAYLHFESGDSPRAEARLHDVLAEVSPGPERARALVRLARIRSYEAQGEAANLFLQAVDEADGHREILAIAHEGVASCFFRLRERLSEGVGHAQLAARLASELEDDALAAEALGSLLVLETLLGRVEVAETAERMLPLQGRVRDQRVLSHPSVAAAIRWWFTDELPRSREALIEMLRRSHELGDESSLPYVLVILGQVECALCEFESSLERAIEGRGAAEQSGQHTLVAYHMALESLVEAQRGHVEPARTAALSALERVPETGGRPAELVATRALGHLELALAAPESAVALLAEAVAFVRREQIAEPGAIPFVVDQVEALIELGRRDEAVELLGWYEGSAQRLVRVSALASSARCRGLLAAQAGELDLALRAYEEALEWHAMVELPLEHGRTLLALGAAQRRMKRRRQARATLQDALAIFDRIGAELWAERAQAELARISGRAATPGALTPAEERVAALVAEGRTNREVAAALFLSERTVEGHLSHVFGKLGLRHRAEVARALAARETQGVAASNTRDTPVSAPPSAP